MSDHVRVRCLRYAGSEHVTTGTAGVLPNTPLSGQGRHQAIEAAQRLAAEPITGIYSSTAQRARQTAEPLATTPDLHITAMPWLVEVGCDVATLSGGRPATRDPIAADYFAADTHRLDRTDDELRSQSFWCHLECLSSGAPYYPEIAPENQEQPERTLPFASPVKCDDPPVEDQPGVSALYSALVTA